MYHWYDSSYRNIDELVVVTNQCSSSPNNNRGGKVMSAPDTNIFFQESVHCLTGEENKNPQEKLETVLQRSQRSHPPLTVPSMFLGSAWNHTEVETFIHGLLGPSRWS